MPPSSRLRPQSWEWLGGPSGREGRLHEAGGLRQALHIFLFFSIRISFPRDQSGVTWAHCSSEQLGWSLFCGAMNNTIPARTLANLGIPGWATHVSEGGWLRSITLTVVTSRYHLLTPRPGF